MFNPWLAFSLNAFQMGVEAQSVIALRMLRLASGNARRETEATRMVTEKIAAAAIRNMWSPPKRSRFSKSAFGPTNAG
jgi:hypothetical protein